VPPISDCWSHARSLVVTDDVDMALACVVDVTCKARDGVVRLKVATGDIGASVEAFCG
jgi:hypothetical protein